MARVARCQWPLEIVWAIEVYYMSASRCGNTLLASRGLKRSDLISHRVRQSRHLESNRSPRLFRHCNTGCTRIVSIKSTVPAVDP